VVPTLAALLAGADMEDMGEAAAGVLARLAVEPGSRKEIAAVPECLQTLADTLQTGDAGLLKNAACVLKHMARDVEFRCKVVELPGVFPSLVALLVDENSVEAAKILESLLLDRRSARACTAVPSCVQRLVAVLRAAALTEVKTNRALRVAVGVFASAPLSGHARDAIVNEPGALQTLVELAISGDRTRDGAREVLRYLGRDVKTGEARPVGNGFEGALDDRQGAVSGMLEPALPVGAGDWERGAGDREFILEEAEFRTRGGWSEEGVDQ
jgi:hypothetical protein